MAIKIMQYRGNKQKFVSIFNAITSGIDLEKYDTYIEPFCGSAAIYFNMNAQFKKYIIGDRNPMIKLMLEALKEYDYTAYTETIEHIYEDFGDIKYNKEAYYKYKTWYNTHNFGSNTIKGIYLMHLYSSCINSMGRFNEKTSWFNQSYGRRWYKMDNTTYNTARAKLKNSTDILTADYEDTCKGIKNAVIMIDSNYINCNYSFTPEFTLLEAQRMLDVVKELSKSNKVILTNFDHEIFDQLVLYGFDKRLTKEILNICPYAKANRVGKEIVMHNC